MRPLLIISKRHWLICWLSCSLALPVSMLAPAARPPPLPSPPPTPSARLPAVQGCALWHNWWPMLTAFVYVLVPMPYLFFGGGAGGSNLASSWQDAGKFLVGFSAVAAVAIPAILYHAQVRGRREE